MDFFEIYEGWFKLADKDQDGRLTGKDAVEFFQRSGLPQKQLAMIWSQADQRKLGFLTLSDFIKAMQLIRMCQDGTTIDAAAYSSLNNRGDIGLPDMKELTDSAGDNNNPFVDAAPATTTGTSSPTFEGSWRLDQEKQKKHRFRTNKYQQRISQAMCTSVIDGLKEIYFSKIRPLEEQFKFGTFAFPYLTQGDFEAKPSVLLLGQYSTGKTTFIKHMLGREYPGANIGPEPTTDRFTVVHWGPEERCIPGNTLSMQPDKPYQGLKVFGTGFLGRFEGSTAPLPLLEEISLVDTPGVLSGEKQRIERQYDFIKVCAWFAGRADLILLLFDPHKLDISDEFKEAIASLRGHDDKVRVVLNKADQVSHQHLMRVYGALMWSLGRVFKSPEVCRVYIGSFNFGHEIRTDKNPYAKDLFAQEQEDLMADLYDIPKRSADRKINEFVKRIRSFKIHTLIIQHLKKQMPMFGKKTAQEKLMQNLPQIFHQVQKTNHLAVGDFPPVSWYRDMLDGYDLSEFPKVDARAQKIIDRVLENDIPSLVKFFDNPYG